MKTIDKSISKGGQSVSYQEVLEGNSGARYRIQIKSDSYPSQCHARVDRWDGAAWREVHAIHYGAMETEPKLAYLPETRPVTDAAFAADRAKLIGVAQAVCEAAPPSSGKGS